MITNEQARIYAQLSHAAHGGTTPAGYQIAKDARGNPITFDDPETGFQAKILKKTGTGDHFVVFTGSQNGQDWAANTALGTPVASTSG